MSKLCHQETRALAGCCTLNLVHSRAALAAKQALSTENADSAEQVTDFIAFFPAQIVIDLSRIRIGAGSRGVKGGFCTKLSTTSVSGLLQTGGSLLQ
jgi:hypothetical protein